MYLNLSTYNIEFVVLAVSTMNLVQKDFLLYEWSSFGLSTLLFRLDCMIETTHFMGNLLSKLQHFFNKF